MGEALRGVKTVPGLTRARSICGRWRPHSGPGIMTYAVRRSSTATNAGMHSLSAQDNPTLMLAK